MFGSGSVWGIDLGHSALKAVRVGRRGGTLTVQAYEVIDLSKATSEAKASREDRLRAAVQVLFSRHSLRSDKLVLSIPAKTGVLSKFIALPPVDRKKIPEMVKFEARQQIPFDLKDVIWGYQPVRKEVPAGESVEIGLFAARRDLVENALKYFQAVGKRLTGVQISPLASYNFVRYDQKIKGAVGVLDMGAENTDLIVISEKGFWLRSLHVAGNNINRVLMEKFNLGAEEVEGIKQRLAESKFRRQVMEVIQPIFRELAVEIDRSLGYYKSLSKDVKIERLLLMGNGIKVAGLEKFLAENLHYPIQKVGDLHSIGVSPGVNKGAFQEALPGLGVALGLAIQGLQASDVTINLLPEEFAFEQEVDRKKPWAIAAGVCLALALGIWYKDEGDVNAQLQPVLANLEDPASSVLVKVERQQKEYDAAEKAISYDRVRFLGNIPHQKGVSRDLWLRLVEQVSEVLPDGVYFRESRSELGDPEEVEKNLKAGGEGATTEAATGAEGAPMAAPVAGAPGPPEVVSPEAKRDVSKHRLNIVLTVETEYKRERGLEFIRLKFLGPLQDISLREDGKPLFRIVEMLNSREEVRNGLGEVVKATDTGGSSEEVKPGGAFDAERLARLKAERTRYLIVPIWCVVNSDKDYADLPETDSVDKSLAELKGGERDSLPTLNILAKEGSGSPVLQVRNNTDTPITVYFSGKKLRGIRVRPSGMWHLTLPAGEYQVGIKSDKAGTKPAYGEQKYDEGTVYNFEYTGIGQ